MVHSKENDVHHSTKMDPGTSKQGMTGKQPAVPEDDNDSTADEDDELDEDDGGDEYGERDPSAFGERPLTLGGEIARKRREKRLAMNRASARARRKRKKVLLDSLSGQVNDLTKKNQELQSENDRLRSRAQHLESAVQQAQATIAALIPSATNSMAGRYPQTASAANAQQESFRSLLQAMTSSTNPVIAAPSGLSSINVAPSPAPTTSQLLAAAQSNQLMDLSQAAGFGQLLSNPSALLSFNPTSDNLLIPAAGLHHHHHHQQQTSNLMTSLSSSLATLTQQQQQQNTLNAILAQAKAEATDPLQAILALRNQSQNMPSRDHS